MLSLINSLLAQTSNPSHPAKDILDQFLMFIYSIAHYIGLGIVKVINLILPMLEDLETLVDPIGFLALITIFIILVTVVRKVAWVIIITGWLLLGVRISLMLLGVV